MFTFALSRGGEGRDDRCARQSGEAESSFSGHPQWLFSQGMLHNKQSSLLQQRQIVGPGMAVKYVRQKGGKVPHNPGVGRRYTPGMDSENNLDDCEFSSPKDENPVWFR